MNTSDELSRKTNQCSDMGIIGFAKRYRLLAHSKLLRLHQWLKNLLLFTPLLAAHQVYALESWLFLIIAFFAFSCCASSVYILNDLLDLNHDRQHSRKRLRPLAAGHIAPRMGILLLLLLLLAGLSLGLCINHVFFNCLCCYFFINCLYSWKLKRYPLIDCLILALSYTMRIIAGAVAVNLHLSFWFITFSVFLFLSLAFIKRYAELGASPHAFEASLKQYVDKEQKLRGRGYYPSDAPLVQQLGISAGYLAVLVFALYLNSIEVLRLYQTVECIWGAVAILLFWVSWMWLQAHRGYMQDDPLVFAIKDPISLLAGFFFTGLLILGAVS